MLNAFRHDIKLTWIERNNLIAEMDVQMAADDEKKFVFIIVRVPIQLTHSFGQLDVILVQLSNQFRRPGVVEFFKFFCQVDFAHRSTQLADADGVTNLLKIWRGKLPGSLRTLQKFLFDNSRVIDEPMVFIAGRLNELVNVFE